MAKDDEKRDAMAEAIFLKCAGNGLIWYVYVLFFPSLHYEFVVFKICLIKRD
jgi:hypothetical protein